MEKDKLLPCPFCGHETNSVSDNGRGLMFNGRCGKGGCSATGPIERCAIDAVHSWNTRSIPNAEGVEAMVEKMARAIGATPAKMGGPVGKYLWDVDLANAARAALESAQLSTLLERVDRLSDDECVICGEHRNRHHTNSGYGMCQIYPIFRSKRAALKALSDEALVSLNVR